MISGDTLAKSVSGFRAPCATLTPLVWGKGTGATLTLIQVGSMRPAEAALGAAGSLK